MTKPGTMRWKTVPSKKPFCTRLAKDAVVAGDVLTARRIVNEPQFVWKRHVVGLGGVERLGGLRLVLAFAGGGDALVHPFASVDVASVLFPPPQPASDERERDYRQPATEFHRRSTFAT